MNRLLRGKAFLFFLVALILLLWYSADKESRENVLELQKKQNSLSSLNQDDNAESRPLIFAQNLAARMGIPKEQIVGPLEKPHTKENLYHFNQEWKKYPLFESTLVIQSTANSQGFEVLKNSLKTVKEVQANTRFDAKEIKENLQKSHPGSSVVAEPKKVLFVQAEKGELAYLLELESKQGEKKQIIVSAISSDILLEKKIF